MWSPNPPKVPNLQFPNGVSKLFDYPMPFLLIYAEHITQNAGLDEALAAIKIARRNIINLRYADDTTFMDESKE